MILRRFMGWLALAAIFMIVATGASQGQSATRAPYDPGTKIMQPQIFAGGVVSTDLDEAGGVFSPDGNDFYFTVMASYTTAPRFAMICVSHFENGHWQRPETVSFSGRYMDFAPHLSADGNKLYFASIRPVPGSKVPRFRIWMAEKSASGWAEPVPLDAPINQEDSHNLDPSVDAHGNLYFASDRKDPAGHLHIFYSRFVGGKFQEPEKLGAEINSDFSEGSPAISPDGHYLVFASNAAPEDAEKRRPQDLIAAGKPYPRQDLYVSVNRNGQWTPARHLEHGINSFAEEVYPSFTPDGKYLFWGSERSGFAIPTQTLTRAEIEKHWTGQLNGRGNIYFISVEALEAEK
jgi:Tol biopolymer transport system component